MAEQPIVRQIVKYTFFKLDPAWRRQPATDRAAQASEFVGAVRALEESVLLRTYSTVGMRGDTDFMLWVVHEDAREVSKALASLNQTVLAGYLTTPYSYLAQTRRSMYISRHEHPGSEGSRTRIVPKNEPYLFVYPFIKTRPWYALSQEERQNMMTQHIEFGHRFPKVTINTSYSFGIDDQEFVVAFESDNVSDFVDLVMELRHSKASMYTLRDTPAFTCMQLPIEDILADLG
jgi:chlorite dismutase